MAYGSCTFSSVMTTACVVLPAFGHERSQALEIAAADLDIVTPLGKIDANAFAVMADMGNSIRIVGISLLFRFQSFQIFRRDGNFPLETGAEPDVFQFGRLRGFLDGAAFRFAPVPPARQEHSVKVSGQIVDCSTTKASR